MIQSLVTCLTALFNSQSTADPFGGSNKSHLLLRFGYEEGAGWNTHTHIKKNTSEAFTYRPIASRDRKERSTSTQSTHNWNRNKITTFHLSSLHESNLKNVVNLWPCFYYLIRKTRSIEEVKCMVWYIIQSEAFLSYMWGLWSGQSTNPQPESSGWYPSFPPFISPSLFPILQWRNQKPRHFWHEQKMHLSQPSTSRFSI